MQNVHSRKPTASLPIKKIISTQDKILSFWYNAENVIAVAFIFVIYVILFLLKNLCGIARMAFDYRKMYSHPFS